MSTSVLVRDEGGGGDFSRWSIHEWVREIASPTEDESIPDFSHWSTHEWLRATILLSESDEPMKMDVSIEEQEKEEGNRLSGAITITSTTSNSDDEVSVRMTPSAMLEYESIEEKENISKAGCDDNSPTVTTSLSEDAKNIPIMDTEESPSAGRLLRQESSLSAFPLPCLPPPALPPLPPEWKEAVDPQTGEKYYYNIETKVSTWERPRSVSITQHDKDAAESDNSSIGFGNGVPPIVEPANPTTSLADEHEDMEANVDIEEKDGEDATQSPTSDSAKIQHEIDSHPAKKRWWRPGWRPLLKSGGDQTKKVISILVSKSGISGDHREMELLKKVPIFELLEDLVLNAICSRLSLKQYLESTAVFRQNEPIEHMLFIVRGNLECREDGNISELKEGDFCGEELLFRCTDTAGVTTPKKNHRARGKHPLSSRTIECMTPVEALSLDSEALEYITTHYKASFASPSVQGAIRYFSQYGWSLAATGKQKAWTSNKEKKGKAPLTAAPKLLEDSTRNEEHIKEHDEKVLNLQNVPSSEDTLGDTLDCESSPQLLPDADEVPKMDPPIEKDTSTLPTRPKFSKKKREGDNHKVNLKTLWGLFKPDGDQSGKTSIKGNEQREKVRKNDDDVHSPTAAVSEELSTPTLTSPSLDENVFIMEESDTPMLTSPSLDDNVLMMEANDTPKLTSPNLDENVLIMEASDTRTLTSPSLAENVFMETSDTPMLTSSSLDENAFMETIDTPMLTSPSLDENVLTETDVGLEEQDTSVSIPVPFTSDSGKIGQENDSHAGKQQKKISQQPVKSGGHHQWKKSVLGIFKSSGDHSEFIKKVITKVPIFERVFELLEGHILEAICEHLSKKRYTKGSEVLLKGEPVTHMLFIVRGKLEYLGDDGGTWHLKEWDVCGEELLSWYTGRVGVSTLKKIDPDGRHPLSSRTIKCLTPVQAFSLDFEALESITTKFGFAFRSPYVQGALRYVSLEWRLLGATRIQKAWRSSKGIIGAGHAHLNHEKEHDSCHEHLEPGEHLEDITLDQDTERENSASGTQEAPPNTDPSESIRDTGDDVPTPATNPPPEVLCETANFAQPPTNHPPEVFCDTANSATTKPPSDVICDTANSAPPLVAEDDMSERNQEANTSNSRQGPSTVSDSVKVEREDDNHSAKKWWRPFRVGNSETKRSPPGKPLSKPEDPTLLLEVIPRKYTYRQLKAATGGLGEESKLGQGGFGSVYRGVLPSSGIQVAVKKMDGYAQNQAVKEFMAEVSIINRLRHRNLIQLLGWCDDAARKKYLLVYELMPNGSLDEALFRQAENETTHLSWPQRFNILTGTAAGLEYLHQGWNQQVVHRDIKCSNIILDKDWNAKLADFGLARLVDHHRTAATTNVAGTMGYIAPEVIFDGRFTEKADVFGFGVVALEVACGRRVFSPHPDNMGLVDFVWHGLSEGDLLSTVDKRLNNDYDEYWMEVVLMVGLLCTHPDPETRPSMRRVVQILAGDVPVPSIPTSKPTAVFSSLPQISISELQTRKAGGKSRARSRSTPQISMTFGSATSSNSHSSIGLTTRSSN